MDQIDKKQIKIVAIVGETSSGKSGLAIEIAKRFDGEIISADSRSIYKGMNIGTAKPTTEEMGGVVHYGFDLVEPSETYSAAQFKDYADMIIADIYKRGKLPILAGGTGLYVDGVLYGYSFGGTQSKYKRSELINKSVVELNILADEIGIDTDIQTRKNTRHLIRLIERSGQTENNKDLAYNSLILGIRVSKSQLRKRVEARVEVMFRRGLRKEYNDLRQKYPEKYESLTGIGYREFLDYEAGKISMSEVKRLIVKNTMNLAKRQRTWFKRNQDILWLEDVNSAGEMVDDFLREN